MSIWTFILNLLDLNIHTTIKKNYIEIIIDQTCAPLAFTLHKFFLYHLPTRGRAGIKLGDAWYVSNISIIFDCSMLLYYLFWMFMGFTLHFYIIFGTNLLTGGPARIAVFLPISVFRRKGISNGVQIEWNLRERDFWNERDPEDLECKSRSFRGSHEIGGRAPPCRVRPLSRGPLGRPPTYFFLLYKPMYPEHPESQRNTISTIVTFCIHEIPYWIIRRRSAGGGIDHGGLLHQHHSPSDEL